MIISMEWSTLSRTFTFILPSIFLLSVFATCNEVYYVTPNDYNGDCPDQLFKQCCNLEDYIKQSNHTPLEPSNGIVTMIFLEGHHTVHETNKALNFGSPKQTFTLHIKGNGPPHKIIIDGLDSGIQTSTIIMENFTAVSTSLFVRRLEIVTNITILNCNFNKSIMILTKVIFNVYDSSFSESTSTAVSLFSSTATFMGNVKFLRNKGYHGGALALIGTTIKIAQNTTLLFKENSATEIGGAIFVINSEMVINIRGYISACFYQLSDYRNVSSMYRLEFINNTANKGGDHIYGTSLNSDCVAVSDGTDQDQDLYSYQVFNAVFSFEPGHHSTLSAVSADATRVCLCDDSGLPQCEKLIAKHQVYPGGHFSIPVVLVGGDHGATVGTVETAFLPHVQENVSSAFLGSTNEYYQVVTNSSECTMLNFSVYSNRSQETLFFTIEDLNLINKLPADYFHEVEHPDTPTDDANYISTESRNTPVFINITLLPCPPGFFLLGDPSGCDCHPVLIDNGVSCIINNLSGYHIWNSTSIWVQASGSNIVSFSKHCPFDYCQPSVKKINFERDPDAQCKPGRTGILCGSCKENFSLAIGSSHCIYCPNNNNLALIIFFAAAGVLLVFVIAALNLTVTQGTINGLVFYTNIVWAYQTILFPPEFEKKMIAFKTLIAWLNLDFGLEACFISGMNAYTKIWFQFVFPFYTAILFFLGLRYSSKLSKLFGSRSVPTLATVLYLSYSKLLRTIIACLQLAMYTTYSNSMKDRRSTNVVWAVDGNLSYGKYPHIFLLLAATACLILLWVPYTLLLFPMQWLRRVDHYGPLRFIAKYKPVYDAYYAPLNDKHHYWFGVLLLVQGALLLVSSLTLITLPALNFLLLLTISIILLCYMNSVRTYRRISASLLESSFLINFIILAVGNLYFKENGAERTILLCVSITVVFIKFCGLIIWNLIPKKAKSWRCQCQRKATNSDQLELKEAQTIEQHSDMDDDEQYVRYRDSIIDLRSYKSAASDSLQFQ